MLILGDWHGAFRKFWQQFGIDNSDSRGPKFRWEPAAGRPASQQAGADLVTAQLRGIRKAIEEVRRVGSKVGP